MSQPVSRGDDTRHEDILPKTKSKRKSVIREYAEAIAIAVVLALFIRTFVIQAFKIPSGSMKPTLLIGDHILVNKFIYGIKIPFTEKTLVSLGQPKRGDVIVFKYPLDTKKDYIKRVIALPIDTVEIKTGRVYINGSLLDEPYIKNPPAYTFQQLDIKDGEYFVLGDNRNNSNDSHNGWTVPRENIVGKAWISIWPPSSWGLVPGYPLLKE